MEACISDWYILELYYTQIVITTSRLCTKPKPQIIVGRLLQKRYKSKHAPESKRYIGVFTKIVQAF